MPSPDHALQRGPRGGFAAGETVITREGLPPAGAPDMMMDFSIVHLRGGETRAEAHAKESAWVLLRGEADVTFAGSRATVMRGSLFDEPPTALHVCAATPIELRAAAAGAEFAVVRTTNDRRFTPRLFTPADLQPEYRGAGLVQNAALRNVRAIFDLTTRPESNLVLGEVVNFPGRWSSYPPHHHDQPEIYFYRFTQPDGYGHAELGDDVVKVRANDTVSIRPGLDHAQVSAPGYGMYYLWMIRHLPGNPYTGFTFSPAHQWTLDPAQQGWRPKDLPPGLA
ncbi:MAG: 5-deoxy-glucuronate isomerase [Verrucomicrobia bacterium]|nr:5-deoxy-glucuronate isomerase [Verrucomicrobiota bacterium]